MLFGNHDEDMQILLPEDLPQIVRRTKLKVKVIELKFLKIHAPNQRNCQDKFLYVTNLSTFQPVLN